MKTVAPGAERADEIRTSMVTTGKYELPEPTTDSPVLPGNTDHYASISLDESLEAYRNELTIPVSESEDSMKQRLFLFVSETDWIAEIEADKDIQGMVIATFTAKSSAEALNFRKAYNCPIDELEDLIRRELSQISRKLSLIGGNLRGTLVRRTEICINRGVTATELRILHIMDSFQI